MKTNYEIYNEYSGHTPPRLYIVRNGQKYDEDSRNFRYAVVTVGCALASVILVLALVKVLG